jgi:hypothetical protein
MILGTAHERTRGTITVSLCLSAPGGRIDSILGQMAHGKIGPTIRQLGGHIGACICKYTHVCKYTKHSFMPDENPSCDPQVYEVMIVSGATCPLAHTLSTRTLEIDMKDRSASQLAVRLKRTGAFLVGDSYSTHAVQRWRVKLLYFILT